HPKYFDDLFVSLVAAGEASGALETLLDKVDTYKEKTESIKGKVRKALVYPTSVIIVAFIVMLILLYFVVPQFEALFHGFNATLPAFTRLVIHLSDVVQNWWWIIFIGIVLSGFLFVRFYKRSYRFHQLVDRLLLKLPVIGNILDKSVVARFARTLSTMFAAGVPLVEALDSVAGAAGNLVYEEGIRQMRSQVATGQRLQLALSNTGLFPSMTQQMIAIGEESGSLDTMCARVADIYEEEVDNQVDSLSSLLEPFIMAVIGVLVGGLIIAMYLPIFQLGSVV
ncbi:MAG TPA: type II secretion system F family protein, partial [Salinisphaeraceae bacterium]|nr:type II secretion system F family protein [Salinisphaeraceae bacterium]